MLVGLDGRCGVDLIPVLGDRRIVKLQHQAGLDDRRVLLAHRLRAGVDQVLVVLVVLVGEARAAARRHRIQVAVLQTLGLKRSLEMGDVTLNRLLADVGDRSARHRGDRRTVGQRGA